MGQGIISDYNKESNYLIPLFKTNWGPEGNDFTNLVVVDMRTNLPKWICVQDWATIIPTSWIVDEKQLTFDEVVEYARRVSILTYITMKGIGPHNWHRYISPANAIRKKRWDKEQAMKAAALPEKPHPTFNGLEYYSIVENSMRPGGNSLYDQDWKYLKTLFDTPWGPEGWGISNSVVVDERTDTPYWISTQYDGAIVAQTWYLDKQQLTFDTVTEYAKRISPKLHDAAEGIGQDNWRGYIPRLKAVMKQLGAERQAAKAAEMRKAAETALADFPNAREILEQMDIDAYSIYAKTKGGYPRFQIDTDCIPSPSWKLYRERNQAVPDNFRGNLNDAIRALAVRIEILQCGEDPEQQPRREALEKQFSGMLELLKLRR